jgi:hypothetical protein
MARSAAAENKPLLYTLHMMKFEGFNRKQSKKKEEQPDPALSSRVVLPGEKIHRKLLPNHRLHGVYEDGEGGKFHRVGKSLNPLMENGYGEESGENHAAISMILKGFANVSSVVPLPKHALNPLPGTKWASYEAPKETEGALSGDFNSAEADRCLVGYLFNDWDHKLFMPVSNKQEDGYAPADNSRNAVVLPDGRNMLYDFGYGWFWTKDKEVTERSPMTYPANLEAKRLLRSKLLDLKAHYESEEGLKQLEAIFKRINKPVHKVFKRYIQKKNLIGDMWRYLDEYPLEEFRDKLVSKINDRLKFIDEKITENEAKDREIESWKQKKAA